MLLHLKKPMKTLWHSLGEWTRATSSEQREPPKRPAAVVSFYGEGRVEHRGLKHSYKHEEGHARRSSTFDPG